MDMKQTITLLTRYVEETLGVSVSVEYWAECTNLPHYLREDYDYYIIRFRAESFASEYLLLLDTREQEQPASSVSKHIVRIRQVFNADVVYVRDTITSYNRKRFIQHKIPFVIPNNQLYLPMLGLDLREYMRQQKNKPESFSPSTQVLLIHVLLNQIVDLVQPLEMAKKLSYSNMTMTRAFDQLEMAELAENSKIGKERHLHFVFQGREMWERAQPYLTTPVINRVYAEPFGIPQYYPYAGESALAHYTMLSEPNQPILAITSQRWSIISMETKLQQGNLLYPDMLQIELWKYPPDKLSQTKDVDRLSLFLSLREEQDERILIALKNLLEGMKW